MSLNVGNRVVDDRSVVGSHVTLDVGKADVDRAVPHADVERRVDDLTHGARRLALHGLGIELEVAREDEGVHHLLVVGDTLGTAFFAHLAALLLGRERFFLPDDRNGRYAEHETAEENGCFFHGT